MSEVTESQPPQTENAEDPETISAEATFLLDAVEGGDEGQSAVAAGGWPHLPATVLDTLWQRAVSAGPTMLGRQVAYALASSLQRGTDTDSLLLPDSADFVSIKEESALALAALAEHLSVQQLADVLDDINTLQDPAHRGQALLLVAPHTSLEVRRRLLQQAWEIIGTIPEPLEKVRPSLTMLPLLRTFADGELPTGFVAEALDLTSNISNTEARLRGLTALAPHLPPTVRIAVLLAVLDTIDTLGHSDNQSAALIALTPHLVSEVHHRALTVAANIEEPGARARALTTLASQLPVKLQPRLRAAALEAVATISSEEERAQALAAFAPHLEDIDENAESFPVLLERALAIAVNMNRRDSMAKALVGLQSRLPRNLQGEALAAVNIIQDEHLRAQLLAELAISLPSDMAVAALAVAHDIRQRDARFTALMALAKNMPPKAAERTWQDALAVVVAFPRQFERVLALSELAPNLTGALRLRALTNALTAARSISKESARVRALTTLAPLLDEQLLADAVADAYTLTQPLERASALTALAPRLPEGEPRIRTFESALQEVGNIMVEYRRARALTNLAAHLPDRLLDGAIEVAKAIEDPYDRSTTFIALMPRLSGDVYEAMIERAWQTAGEIMDHYDRASALATLWPLASPEKQQAVMRAILNTVTQIADDYDRASGVTLLAPLLAPSNAPSALPQESLVLREAVLAAAQLDAHNLRADLLSHLVPYWVDVQPSSVAYALWCETLPILSRRTVPHLLSDLTVLAPVLYAVGGTNAAREAAQAVSAARAW